MSEHNPDCEHPEIVHNQYWECANCNETLGGEQLRMPNIEGERLITEVKDIHAEIHGLYASLNQESIATQNGRLEVIAERLETQCERLDDLQSHITTTVICGRCGSDTEPLTLPDSQVVGWYCGDCHAVTTEGGALKTFEENNG